VRWLALLAGALLAIVAVVILWDTGVVEPPESVTRTIAALSALYPQSTRNADIDRIPCTPLRRLRLYVVCTSGCEDTWVIVGVRGLRPDNLANPGRIPQQPVEESRKRIAAAVAAEGLNLDRQEARDMIGCYLRLEGLLPELVLAPADLVALEAARGNDDEMKRLAEGLDAPDALSRIDPEETGDGFRAHLYYWDTSRPGRPVLEMDFSLEKNGVVRSLDASESLRGGSVSGSTQGTPRS